MCQPQTPLGEKTFHETNVIPDMEVGYYFTQEHEN